MVSPNEGMESKKWKLRQGLGQYMQKEMRVLHVSFLGSFEF